MDHGQIGMHGAIARHHVRVRLEQESVIVIILSQNTGVTTASLPTPRPSRAIYQIALVRFITT